jgi:hypothetical protein
MQAMHATPVAIVGRNPRRKTLKLTVGMALMAPPSLITPREPEMAARRV